MEHPSKKASVGDFVMRTNVYPDAEGFLECEGKLTSSVYFGISGVGKSTVAGLSATSPGLFETKASIDGTTTLGTWISTALGRVRRRVDRSFNAVFMTHGAFLDPSKGGIHIILKRRNLEMSKLESIRVFSNIDTFLNQPWKFQGGITKYTITK